MAKLVKALHTISGQVGLVREDLVNHPVLGVHLVEVADDAKSYIPELFKATTPEEFEKKPRRHRKKQDEEPEVTEEPAPVADVAESFDNYSIDEDN